MESNLKSLQIFDQQVFVFLREERKRYNSIVATLEMTGEANARGELKKQRRISQRLLHILVPAHRNLRKYLRNVHTNTSLPQTLSVFYRQLVDVLLGGVAPSDHPVWELTLQDDDFGMHVREGKLKDLYARAGTSVTTSFMLGAYEREVMSTLVARSLGGMRDEYEKRTSDFARNRSRVTKALLERLRPVVSEEEYAILEDGLRLSM